MTFMLTPDNDRGHSRPSILLSLAAAFCLLLAAAHPVAAEDAAPVDEAAVERGLQVFKEGGCRACHGWSANGVREGENIQGPSLRATQLAPADIRTTVQCGRLEAMMPYYDWQAYNLDTRCYGLDRFHLQGINKPPKGRKSFNAQQLDDLVAYLQARVIGHPPLPTREECLLFFGGDDRVCQTIQQ